MSVMSVIERATNCFAVKVGLDDKTFVVPVDKRYGFADFHIHIPTRVKK